MQLPYLILGVAIDADDATIRQRYLALVRQYPPSTAGDQFAAISASYEAIKDARSRAREAALGATRFAEARSGLIALRRAAARQPPTLATLMAPAESKNA